MIFYLTQRVHMSEAPQFCLPYASVLGPLQRRGSTSALWLVRIPGGGAVVARPAPD